MQMKNQFKIVELWHNSEHWWYSSRYQLFGVNETKQDKKWPNTEDFRLENYSFNTGNICSMIGQIVTEFYQIFQHFNK
jgi:hypothetical protein